MADEGDVKPKAEQVTIKIKDAVRPLRPLRTRTLNWASFRLWRCKNWPPPILGRPAERG